MSKYTSSLPKNVKNVKVDRVIYCFWTGDNELTENRKRGLQALRDNACVEVKLITPQNLNEYILPEDPLPDCYQCLSHVHKADYLRCYFMHHYGGGYSDIKYNDNSWLSAFDRLDKSNAYICGYPEISPESLATPKDAESLKDIHLIWKKLLGNGAYICRPKTRFTDEWYYEMKKRVLANSEELNQHPALDPFGSNSDYPIPWTYILGDIFHPLCLKYNKELIQEKSIQPDFQYYR